MKRNRKTPQLARPAAALELPPERAFVVHLDLRARPPGDLLGRVEHITSGQVAHITSLDELAAFMAKALGQHARTRARRVSGEGPPTAAD